MQRVCAHSVMSSSFQPHGLYSRPGSSVQGIFQARILEWVAFYWRDLPGPGIESTSLVSPALAGRFLASEPPGKPQMSLWILMSKVKSVGQWRELASFSPLCHNPLRFLPSAPAQCHFLSYAGSGLRCPQVESCFLCHTVLVQSSTGPTGPRLLEPSLSQGAGP